MILRPSLHFTSLHFTSLARSRKSKVTCYKLLGTRCCRKANAFTMKAVEMVVKQGVSSAARTVQE
eukprot:5795393-Pyramimonas_sp.AAC.1